MAVARRMESGMSIGIYINTGYGGLDLERCQVLDRSLVDDEDGWRPRLVREL
jgi:hypothetical protein